MKPAWLLLAASAALFAAPPEGTLISSRVAAFNPLTGKTYLVDARHNTLWIFHGSNNPVPLAVGKSPSAVAVDTHTGRAYVANAGDGTVSIVEAETDRVLAKVNAGPHPYVLAVNSAAGKVYVTNTFSNLVAEIDSSTLAVQLLKLGSADAVAVDTQSNKVFLISYEDPNVKIMDAKTHALQKANVGEHMWGLAVNEQTGTVYVTRVGAAELAAIDEKTLSVQRARVGQIPCALAIDDKTSRAYTVNYGDNSVTALDTKTLRPLTTVKVGSHPQAIALSEERGEVYVANRKGQTLSIIAESSNQVEQTKPAGDNPIGLALSAQPAAVLAANLGPSPWTKIAIR